jgi:hypothetical protein
MDMASRTKPRENASTDEIRMTPATAPSKMVKPSMTALPLVFFARDP